MSNYFYEYNYCVHCKQSKEFHVGKESYGWKFLFRFYPSPGDNPRICSFNDLKDFVSKNPGKFIDHEGNYLSPTEFYELVEGKQGEAPHPLSDPDGYDYLSEEFC